MELNPNHPIVRKMRDQELWHKIVALLMQRFGASQVVITMEDVERLASSKVGAVTVQDTPKGLVLTLVSMEEAEILARKHGGLPS